MQFIYLMGHGGKKKTLQLDNTVPYLNLPKISCLCITQNSWFQLKRCIQCFNAQIYPNKELIIVYESNNKCIDKIKKINMQFIKLVEIPIYPKKTLGELRNISISNSIGKYVCQWDDDDYYHSLRLMKQYSCLLPSGKPACILNHWYTYDNDNDVLYSKKSGHWFEGSILAEKSILSKYENKRIAEDTPVISKLNSSGQLCRATLVNIYVYIYHGQNTWDKDHFNIFIKSSDPVTNNPLHKLLKQSIINEIKAGLPEQYGEVTINCDNIQPNIDTAIIIPCFGRPQYVKQTLDSLAKTDLTNAMIIILDETNSQFKDNPYDKFIRFDNINSSGNDCKHVYGGSMDKVIEIAEADDNCIACNENGQLKTRIDFNNIWHHRSSKYAFYVKKTYLKKYPAVHQWLNKRTSIIKQSTDMSTKNIISSFQVNGVPIIKIFKTYHGNMYDSIKCGADMAINTFNVKYIVNLDSDTIHKKNWLTSLRTMYHDVQKSFTGPIICGGFNYEEWNGNFVKENIEEKQLAAGINMFYNATDYKNVVRWSLVNTGWDIALAKLIKKTNGHMFAIYPSVIQHIGKNGMWSTTHNHCESNSFSQ